MKPEVKKQILSNAPYLLFVYLFGKLGQTYRLARKEPNNLESTLSI